MSLQVLFTALALAALSVSAVLFLLVIFQANRKLANLALAIMLFGLGVGVWWTTIRQPLPLP